MTFAEDTKITTIETVNPEWNKVETSLKMIDPLNKTFFVLTDDSGSYIQCAGSNKALTIELREYEKNAFKHFVIGKEKNKNALNPVWTQIDCRVGPIRIYDNEAMTIIDAIEIFKVFYNNKILPSYYTKRNVTKQFEK